MLQTYLIPCNCGHDLAVKAGQAGCQVRCARCSAPQLAPRLTALRSLPIVAGQADEHPGLQFSLPTLLGCVALVAVMLRALTLGYYLPLIAIVLASAVWGLGAALFHRAFVEGSVIVAAV